MSETPINRGFVKLDTGIVDSSLWFQDHDVLRVWLAFLAKADKTGYVRVASKAMAHLCMVSTERLEAIVAILEAPDEGSRTPDHDGRRIESVDGGWRILNYQKYRESGGSTERVRKHRERLKQNETECNVTKRVKRPESESDTESEEKIQSGTSSEEAGQGVLDFVVKGKPHSWSLPKQKLQQWEELYGDGMDVMFELRKARQWCEDNPPKRKTARGMTKFLSGWLERANNRGTGKAPARGDVSTGPDKHLEEQYGG